MKAAKRKLSDSETTMEWSPSYDMLTEIQVKKDVSREVMDPSEDSGLSSISDTRSKSDDFDQKYDSTIGDGITFVDPQIIEQEVKEKEAVKIRCRKVNPEIAEEKRQIKLAYEKEMKEKNYKCLMHILRESQAMSSFLTEKVDAMIAKEDKPAAKNTKRKSKASAKGNDPPPKKRGRTSKARMNLSDEDIETELASMSDEEGNDQVTKDNVKLKYFTGELRDYQNIGLTWLKALYVNGVNGILADEMGLGKTVQIIALFSYLFEQRVPGPYMIVVPLSTLPNWVSEFERFAPKLPVVVFHGTPEARAALKPKIFNKARVAENFYTQPIVLTTYQIPPNESSFFRKFNWRYIVIDEAQRIKNFNSQLNRILKTFKSVNRLLLTGTPLQNNLSELWSLLNYLLPELFDKLEVFEAWFNAKEVQDEMGQKKFFKQEQEKKVMLSLREILKPLMLRRLKEDVCPEIPPLKEVMVYAPMTKLQFDLYLAIVKRDVHNLQNQEPTSVIIDDNGVRPKRRCLQRHDLSKVLQDYKSGSSPLFNSSVSGIKDESTVEREVNIWKQFIDVTDENKDYLLKMKLSNQLMVYRHVTNHPYLIYHPADDCKVPYADESVIKVSGKLLMLDAMLKKLKADGHKVLLFSNMSMVLDIIEEYLYPLEYEYVRLDGNVKFDKRKENISKFQEDPEVFLFLMTTKAGAVGLNLSAADTVIIYDSDWNPQNDLQAMARCHRIGQTKPVVVYKLCTRGTIDEEIIKRGNSKRFLEKAVISKEGSLLSSAEDLMKLKTMLDENMYDIVDSKNEVYTAAQLDALMKRS